MGRLVSSISAAAIAALSTLLSPGLVFAQNDQPFDELRFGVSASIQSGGTREDGLFTTATVFFDPFGANEAQGLKDKILHPRIHAGAIISTSGETDQIFAGFTWTVDVTDRLFIDLGFGGALNNGTLHDSDDGPSVGCHALFHESLAVGYKITEAWRLMATVDHSSNANLCHDNDGLSYAGLAVGRKF
ncbi:acyloxyacyl hydrolase [Neorhizobium lilium]|uniref:Acyloxyacyl hydrolase n=1 Tax=Neorhizobium lilium TaxID=2503024 RepID=A0A3S3VFK8_9HYPH|nr:acyloxyacyl hydrolase [Neorhizobium lilium]RWX75479.1 acyloxyacyl hydrolase [Neorhizobium lilium]